MLSIIYSIIRVVGTITLLLLFTFTSSAQEVILNGKIVTEKGDAIPYCHVIIMTSPTQGAISNYNGEFTLKTSLTDTILIKYMGFEDYKGIVINSNPMTFVLKQSIINLPEFTIKPSLVHKLSAKNIVKKAVKNWKINHIALNSSNENYKWLMNLNITCKKNEKDIYSFNHSASLYSHNKKIYGNSLDSVYRNVLPKNSESLNNLESYHPYHSILYYLYKLPINNQFDYEFGDMSYFQNQEVYQIKFHRAHDKVYCESGGYFLISKLNYTLIYMEQGVIYCNPYIVDNPEKKYKLQLDYSKDVIQFKPQINGKYTPSEIETIQQLTYTDSKGKGSIFYSTFKANTISVHQVILTEDVVKTLKKLQAIFIGS